MLYLSETYFLKNAEQEPIFIKIPAGITDNGKTGICPCFYARSLVEFSSQFKLVQLYHFIL